MQSMVDGIARSIYARQNPNGLDEKTASQDYRIRPVYSFVSIHWSKVQMFYRPERTSVLAKVKERGFSGAFLGLALLAMLGWVYLLSTIFFKFVLWCFS